MSKRNIIPLKSGGGVGGGGKRIENHSLQGGKNESDISSFIKLQ